MSDTTGLRTPAQVIADILASHDIRLEHPDDCLAEAEYWLQTPGLDDLQLVDWRSLPFITIDNPGSRDLDQALLIEQSRHGYRVRYALADASYYVRPGSALFREALLRGATYYTPLIAAPMLPVILSEGLVSLNPRQDRRALVFDMLLDTNGNLQRTTIVRASIHSQAQLTYAGVQDFLDADDKAQAHAFNDKPFTASIRLLKTVGEQLIELAKARNVVPFERIEANITVEDEPPRFSIRQRRRYATEKYNEQISLLCNMQGALLLAGYLTSSNELQAIFRVHDAPLDGRLSDLRRRLDSLADLHSLGPEFRWHKGRTLADYVAALPETTTYDRIVQAIERQILISNRASEFRAEPGRHHALGADSYARFSSPMREVVGIYTHKELLEVLTARGIAAENDEIHQSLALREQVVEVANRAKQTQKQIDKAIEFEVIETLLDGDLNQSPRPLHCGTIVGIKTDRLYIAVDAFAVGLKVYRQDLEAQYKTDYTFDGVQGLPVDSDKPRWRLGDGVRLSARHYDSEHRRYVLDIHVLGDS
jgi:ribonuclease R